MMEYTPIVHGLSLDTEPNESDSVLLSLIQASPNVSPQTPRKRTVSEDLTPPPKRPKTTTDCSNQVSFQYASIATNANANANPSLLHSLQVKKSVGKAPGVNYAESDMSCMDQMSLQCSAAESETPRALASANAVHPPDVSDSLCDSNDAYPLDDGISDDDILHLLTGSPNYVQETNLPPSSVQGWSHGSQSATEYDPTLKYSPLGPQETDASGTGASATFAATSTGISEDLLDEDVDWNAVMANTDVIHKGSSPVSHPEIDTSKGPVMTTRVSISNYISLGSDEVGYLAPFRRPPFPDKVRDRPLVPGMSSNTILRTCFRIGAMISQTASCFNRQQDVIFELYARVTYSNRESMARKQHFQFVDLFKDQHPYPAATLTNWRVGSQIDKDSQMFLDTSRGPQLCRCVCKPMRDPKAVIGWTYTVLSIKQIDLEQIRWAKRYICGDT